MTTTLDTKARQDLVLRAERLSSKAPHAMTTQLRNLQNVAQQEDCIEALKLYVRYQAARKPGEWGELGTELPRELEEVHKARGMEGVRLMLGYLQWAFRVQREAGKKQGVGR